MILLLACHTLEKLKDTATTAPASGCMAIYVPQAGFDSATPVLADLELEHQAA